MRNYRDRPHAGHGSAEHDLIAALLHRSARGDQRAFAALYDQIASRVHGITLRILVDPTRAEQVTQEIFVEVWSRAASFDPSRGSASAWITTLAHTRAVQGLRSTSTASHRGTPRSDETAEASHRGSAPAPDRPQVEAPTMLDGLALLPTSQRRAIELAYFDGHGCADVALLMDAPLATTTTRLRTALMRLGHLSVAPRTEAV